MLEENMKYKKIHEKKTSTPTAPLKDIQGTHQQLNEGLCMEY